MHATGHVNAGDGKEVKVRVGGRTVDAVHHIPTVLRNVSLQPSDAMNRCLSLDVNTHTLSQAAPTSV